MKKWMAALCLLGLLTGCTAMTEKNGSLQSEKNEPQTAENGAQSEENTQNMRGKNEPYEKKSMGSSWDIYRNFNSGRRKQVVCGPESEVPETAVCNGHLYGIYCIWEKQ